MSLVTSITNSIADRLARRVGDVVLGAGKQLVNELLGAISLPIPGLPGAPVGDLLEITGTDARRGAELLERAIEAFSGIPRVDANRVRETRPLLATTTVTSIGGGMLTRIAFTATAAGANWGTAGRESGRIAIYVGGVYHSSVAVLAERDGSYSVDIGPLPPGAHTVELRASADTAGTPGVQVAATALRTVELSGDDALVARHAPILELRDVDPRAAHSTARSDMPMLLVPAVERNADGSRTITYRVAFSNEEGGTTTPKLLNKYGRTADLEPVYRVRVDAWGRALEASYQSALHQWKPFTGERVGERPVLRTSTANGMSSTRVHRAGDGSERWSEAPVAAVDAATSDYEVMSRNAWTWQVMAKELVREGKADPRRFVFLGPLTDAQRGAILAAGGLELLLADGTRVMAPVSADFAAGPYRQGAVELPPSATADALVGVSLAGVRVGVLDASLQLRELARA